MPKCIVTDNEITQQNDSKAHVIPSALGGRLKPLGILSKDGNGLLGEKIDLPLIQSFQSLMTLLNGTRDRGKNQPVRMADASGRAYVVEFGHALKLANPEYREQQTDDGPLFHINARNLRELRTLLGRVKAKHPDFDIDEALKHAVTVREWPDGILHGQWQIGPRSVFPALYTSASIFAVHHGHAPPPLLKDYVARFDPNNPEIPPATFYFIPPRPWISTPCEVTHIVALLASARRKELLVYFELFNAVPVGVLMPYAGTEDARALYAVDVLSGTEVQATIDDEALDGVPWKATHQLGDAALFSFTTERLSRVMRVAQQRAFDAAADDLTKRFFGGRDGQPLTPTGLINGIAEFVDHALLEWQRPTLPLVAMEGQLQAFSEMVGELEKSIPPPAQPQFRALMNQFQGRLGSEIERLRNRPAVSGPELDLREPRADGR